MTTGLDPGVTLPLLVQLLRRSGVFNLDPPPDEKARDFQQTMGSSF